MKVRFVASNPHEKALPLLDDLLTRGTDQIAIACAFLTPGGAELMRRHAPRIKQANSFLVVAWDPPTSRDALDDLHRLIPGNLYVHLGVLTPVEKEVGPGLMHSKLFFARAGDDCWMWIGSHNLTASAIQGVNSEAAVILEGKMNEDPFAGALAHLLQCRREAVPFDPFNPPPDPWARQTLVIHAERHAPLKAPPWFVHLRPASADYDRAMRPPAAVWLYLYPPRTLKMGQPRPLAEVAFSGTLTALNFTEVHPQRGIPADWTRADYVIEHIGGVFRLQNPTPYTRTPTQGVFRVDFEENPRVVWLTESPSPKLERVAGNPRLEEVDPDFLKFFTSKSVRNGALVRQPYEDLRPISRVQRKEIGNVPPEEIAPRVLTAKATDVAVKELSDADDKFAFIYRAKYRI